MTVEETGVEEASVERDAGQEDTSVDTSVDTSTDTGTDDKEAIKAAKEEGVSAEEAERMRAALKKANAQDQKRREELKAWKDLGTDPTKVQELMKREREAEVKRAEEQGRYQELIDNLEADTRKRQEDNDAKMAEKDAILDRAIRQTEISKAVAAEGGIAELLEEKLQKETKTIITDDGVPKAVLLGTDGEPRLNDAGEYMQVSERVKELKTDKIWSHAFPAPKKSGSGVDSKTSGKEVGAKGVPKTSKPKSQMSPEEKNAFRKEYGLEAYQKLSYS